MLNNLIEKCARNKNSWFTFKKKRKQDKEIKWS